MKLACKSMLSAATLILMSVPSTSVANSIGECFPAPEGLVAWWTGDGNASDIQGDNNGTLANAAGYAQGKVAEAFRLNGSDYVEVPHSQDFNIQNELTLTAWIKKEGNIPHNGPIIAKQIGTGPCCNDLRYALTVYGDWGPNHVVLSMNTDYWQDIVESNTSILDNEWYHLVGTYDGTTSKIYVNGALDNFRVRDGVIKPSTGGPLFLGLGRHSYDEFFNGLIDEAQVYNRALMASEIAAIYDAGLAGQCKDVDGDGYRPPQDCDESDPAINPDATELPGNFVDENCDGNLGDCSPCADWRNHGEYVRCVAHAVNELTIYDSITQESGDSLVASAAQSEIGKKGFSPPNCNSL